ncbi:MAG: hypothetical protein WCF68_15450 [Terriglobales bacterium]
MIGNCLTKPTRTIALLSGLLFAIAALSLGAYAATDSRVGRGFGPAYDAAHETIVTGTIKEVVTKHELGSPAGMHLLVSGAQGVVDAHVGSLLSKRTIEALQTGTPVRIVGASVTLHGKEFFLARQLTIAGRTVTVRSQHGFLVHEHPAQKTHSSTEKKTVKTSQVELNGGAR